MSWHFTKYGFFSAVCPRKGKNGDGKPDLSRRMIRVRSVEHLANLRARFPVEMKGVQVHESKTADYPARVFLPVKVWVRMLCEMEEDVDYDNFKQAVADAKLTEPSYKESLSSVWGVMRRFQDMLLHAPVIAALRSLRPMSNGDPRVPLGPGEVPAEHDARMAPVVGVPSGERTAIVSIRTPRGEVPAALCLGANGLSDAALLAELVERGMMGDIEFERVRFDRVPWRRVDPLLHSLPVYDLLQGQPS